MEWIIAWLALAIGAGAVASSKGRSGFGYFVLGVFLPLIGLLIAIGMAPVTRTVAQPSAGDLVLCHRCRQPRKLELRTCPHCGAREPDPHDGQKKCPACAEWILAEAKKCKHCGEVLPSLSLSGPVQPSASARAPMNWAKIDQTERDLDQRHRR